MWKPFLYQTYLQVIKFETGSKDKKAFFILDGMGHMGCNIQTRVEMAGGIKKSKTSHKIMRNKFVTYRHINSHRKLLSTPIPVGTTMLHGLRCSIFPSPSAGYQSFLLSCEVVCMSLTAELEPANKISRHL